MPLNGIEACMQIMNITILRSDIKQGEKYNTTKIRIVLAILIITSSVLSTHYDSMNKYYVWIHSTTTTVTTTAATKL
jgi:hypothetical protein